MHYALLDEVVDELQLRYREPTGGRGENIMNIIQHMTVLPLDRYRYRYGYRYRDL